MTDFQIQENERDEIRRLRTELSWALNERDSALGIMSDQSAEIDRYRAALDTVSFHHDISDGALEYLQEALDG